MLDSTRVCYLVSYTVRRSTRRRSAWKILPSPQERRIHSDTHRNLLPAPPPLIASSRGTRTVRNTRPLAGCCAPASPNRSPPPPLHHRCAPPLRPAVLRQEDRRRRGARPEETSSGSGPARTKAARKRLRTRAPWRPLRTCGGIARLWLGPGSKGHPYRPLRRPLPPGIPRKEREAGSVRGYRGSSIRKVTQSTPIRENRSTLPSRMGFCQMTTEHGRGRYNNGPAESIATS